MVGETEVPIIDFGAYGPLRCTECRGYVNPYFKWYSGGNKFKCNLCQKMDIVPTEYFCKLDY